jgi:3-phosphoshikimate 1-carboxyvinyltransferase
MAESDSIVKVNNLKSKPYIDMTTGILKDFGITVENEDYSIFRIKGQQKFISREYKVEGDWSGAAFLLVAGAINGDLKITGLNVNSFQSDKAILEALEMAGADLKISADCIEITKSALKPFELDATESPDLFPPAVALAAFCSGTSRIRGASRLVHKESNRAQALVEEFGKMDISIELKDDWMLVKGGQPITSRVMSHEDHRIAMAAAVAALGATGRISIKDSHCVAKSYPDFFDDLHMLGAKIIE